MSKAIFKVVDDKGRVVIPAPIRTALGLSPGDIVGVTMDGSRVAVKKAIVLEDYGAPTRAQRSGSCGERRNSGTIEHSRLRGCERCGACDDAMSLDAKQAYAETVMRELPPDRLAEVLELAVRRLKELSPPF